MLNIEIDGQKLQVEEGSMVIEAADAAGIYIPRFCYHQHLSVAANCRMCLVDVERVAKPVPACATPVTEGMRVFTHSEKTVKAQQGVMEFLLINHPLDCPICDQGGECELQDLAVGYGCDVSRYTERKRVVKDDDLGPLIATDMTRCIHCTRCVRFGQEIAGIMELGATGRGEHMRIGTYVASTVGSELSGNMIDLCPVGALTSKPFRYSARTWELEDHVSVSPHDCVGSNLKVQVLRGKVHRVLPHENNEVNDVWLSDRDRFSYTALSGPGRLHKPRVRRDGQWHDVDWATALDVVAKGLSEAVSRDPDTVAGLAAPQSTLEESWLLARLIRGLGSRNVDHRLRQRDFSDDEALPRYPSLGLSLKALEDLDVALLVGASVRKQQPMLSYRLRKAFQKGAKMLAIESMETEFPFSLHARAVVAPPNWLDELVAVLKEVNRASGVPVPEALKSWAIGVEPTEAHRRMADALVHGTHKLILLGNDAQMHPRYADLKWLAEALAQAVGATFGVVTEGSGVGGWLAGCVPHRDEQGRPVPAGRDAYRMWSEPRDAYVLLGTEPEVDAWDTGAARAALLASRFVVMLTPFASAGEQYAHVQLPMAPFTETDGSFVNCEGRLQRFVASAPPQGDARPGWKILRALGGLMQLPGFDFTSLDAVQERFCEIPVAAGAGDRPAPVRATPGAGRGLWRIGWVPPYSSDAIVRRAGPLQETADQTPVAARLNARDAGRLGVTEGLAVRITTGAGDGITLPLVIDPRVPDGCALVPTGQRETHLLCGATVALEVAP